MFIASTVVCCAPFGLILMWALTAWKTSVKVAVSVITFGFYTLAMISAALSPPPQTVRVEASQPEPSVTTTERQPEPPPTQRTISEVPEPATPAKAAADSPACRDGEPLANVDDADDLQVVDECRTVSGTVTDVTRDGDSYQIRLRPDDSSLVTEANTDGLLVVVMVAADRADCAELTTGACTGAELTPPVAGEHVYLTGPYVYDTVTGAMAIVPLWAASASDPTTTTTTTLQVETTPPPTTQPPPQTTAAPAPMPPPSPTTTVASSAGATAICNDGTYSYSQHRRGTCSHHGGVKVWLKDVPA